MSDLAVKLFMDESGIEDFETAKSVMFQYGLADPYLKAAEDAEAKDDEPTAIEAFIDGLEMSLELVSGLRFGVTSDAPKDFTDGLEVAMDHVKKILQIAVDTAKEDGLEDRVREATPLPLSQEKLLEIISSFFDTRREPPAR